MPAQIIIFTTATSISFDQIPYSLIADDESFSLVMRDRSSSTNAFYATHYQIPWILEMSSWPIYNIDNSSNYTFTETSDSRFELTNHTLAQYNATLAIKLDYQPQPSTSSYTFSIFESESYILSLADSMTQNITLNIGQNHTENIVLPCSIDTFDTLTYANHDNGVDPIPSWVVFDSATSTLDISVPEDIQPSNHTYMVETTYPHGSVINYYYISVVE